MLMFAPGIGAVAARCETEYRLIQLMTTASKPMPTADGPGFTVRPLQPADITATRAHIVRVLDEDLGSGYRPEWHGDIDDMLGVYIEHPRQALWVAVDETTRDIIGTIALNAAGPNSPPHPAWLAERYGRPGVVQVLRAYIAREHRRRGIARSLVEVARQFVAEVGVYDTIYLHTNAGVPGAEPFWRAMPTTEIYDGRRNTEGYSQAVHFELAIPR
jgi:GNAT superfamily N-acetyltransferase